MKINFTEIELKIISDILMNKLDNMCEYRDEIYKLVKNGYNCLIDTLDELDNNIDKLISLLKKINQYIVY